MCGTVWATPGSFRAAHLVWADFDDFFDFWRYQPTKAQAEKSTTATTWEAFDPSRYSPRSPELADMQDASGNRRVGKLGGRELNLEGCH